VFRRVENEEVLGVGELGRRGRGVLLVRRRKIGTGFSFGSKRRLSEGRCGTHIGREGGVGSWER